MKKGIFITLEGIDFSGKSTQARAIINLFKKNGLDYIFLREPGGTKLSERVRRILLNKGEIDIGPRSELWLYLAARSQIVEEKILPALKKGQIILCDRFYDSTIAYQVYGRGLDKDFVTKAILYSAYDLVPDLTLLYDLPVKEAFKRRQALKRAKDRLENEKLRFFEKVRKGYLSLAREQRKRFRIVDASEMKETVREHSLDLVVQYLRRKKIKIEK